MPRLRHLQQWLLVLAPLVFASSCSVISTQVRTEAEPAVSFTLLLEDPERYMGKTVILGGYILETANLPGETIIKVLQTPLEFRDRPKAKDYSKGRFIVSHKGFLDPEVYSKDRKITVAGTVSGKTVEKIGDYSSSFLKVVSREIYLWADVRSDYPYPYYDYWYYPYPYDPFWYYPYPYYWHPYPRHHRKR
jgi:outer membrane lipoprotein